MLAEALLKREGVPARGCQHVCLGSYAELMHKPEVVERLDLGILARNLRALSPVSVPVLACAVLALVSAGA